MLSVAWRAGGSCCGASSTVRASRASLPCARPYGLPYRPSSGAPSQESALARLNATRPVLGISRGALSRPENIPFRVQPMLATLVPEPFNAKGWVFEEKYDGYRIL